METHNFDTERGKRAEGDRHKFTICGEEFEVLRTVPPEIMARYLDMGEETGEMEAVKVVDETICAFLTPESEGRWRALRDRQVKEKVENPINYRDVLDVIRWLMVVTAGRPTQPLSDSPSSDGGNGTGSTEPSSPAPVGASAVSHFGSS